MLVQLKASVTNAEKRKKAHGIRRKAEEYEQPSSYASVVKVRVVGERMGVFVEGGE